MNRIHSIFGTIVALGAVILLAGAPAMAAGDLIKVNRYAMAQEQEGVRVAVSWELALHSKGEFVPLLINVVNAGSGSAQVELENFRLVDAEGDTYLPASYNEILTVHRNLGRDKRLAREFEYGGLNTRMERFVESSFYPHEQGTQDSTTELLSMTQMIDMVYFRIPERLQKQELTLVVEGVIDAPAYRIPFSIGK